MLLQNNGNNPPLWGNAQNWWNRPVFEGVEDNRHFEPEAYLGAGAQPVTPAQKIEIRKGLQTSAFSDVILFHQICFHLSCKFNYKEIYISQVDSHFSIYYFSCR